jgi:hypothetical protein
MKGTGFLYRAQMASEPSFLILSDSVEFMVGTAVSPRNLCLKGRV